MTRPSVLISVSGGNASFRLQSVDPVHFPGYLQTLRLRLPHMRWNRRIGMWQLPIHDLKPLYEACRSLFGPENIYMLYPDYIGSEKHIQLSLFDS